MPSAVGYGGYAPRNPSGHLSGLPAGIHADPLLLLLERLHHTFHEPEKRSALSSTVRVEGTIGRANGCEVWTQLRYPLNITP